MPGTTRIALITGATAGWGASINGIPSWMWLTPDRVVREGLADAKAGKSVSIPAKRYKALVFLSEFSSDRVSVLAGRRGR